MDIPSKYLDELVEHFSSLPGIGKKTALRMVLNLLKRDAVQVENFAKALSGMMTNISTCHKCGNIADSDTCSICLKSGRDQGLICVVEDIRDIMAIEATGQFSGVYHVLGGVISPIEGIGPGDLNINGLLKRVEEDEIREIILALSASMEGDTTNFYLYRKLAGFNIEITTLSRGVSVGMELHYTDELTLGRSILNRTPFELQTVKK